tara:strand:- start:46 stop:330 length:285 start_codon:yes stop_codon:yes gene_type:complete
MKKFNDKYGSLCGINNMANSEQWKGQLDFVNEDTGFVISIKLGKCGWLSFESLYLVKWLCKGTNLPRTDYYKTIGQAITGCQEQYDADILQLKI